MYNEERKLRFMDDTGMDGLKRTFACTVFNVIEPKEVELDKDLAEFSADEVGSALATSDVVSSNTLTNRLPFVVRYKNWCAEQGFDARTMATSEIKVDLSDIIRRIMVPNPARLKEILDIAFKETTAQDSKCIYKAHLWMGFAGMQDLDTIRVRTGDINYRECSIFLDNRMYFFPREGLRDIKRAVDLSAMERLFDGKIRTFRRADGDRVLRGRKLQREITDKQYLMKTLRPATGYWFRSAGFDGMSFARIRKSGIFYEMFKREIKGIPVNFYEVGNDDFVFEGKKPTPGQTKQKILRRIIFGYEKDYAAWKRAFAEELKQEFGIDKIPESPKE